MPVRDSPGDCSALLSELLREFFLNFPVLAQPLQGFLARIEAWLLDVQKCQAADDQQVAA
jgi:hypothetical protein